MTCDQVWPLLEAFTAHELGWGTAWRVRRHLAACPACASELAETSRLDARVRAWRDVPAPASLQSRIAAALAAVAPAAAPRRPVVVRRAVVGFAGVAAASAAFFWLVPGHPGRPTIAFADVEQAMQQVKSVSYDMNSHIYDKQGRLVGGVVVPGVSAQSYHNWLRRTPAANAQYDANMHEWRLEDERGTVSYSQRLNEYLKQQPDGNIGQTINKRMRLLTEPPADEAPDPLHYNDYRVQPWQRQETTLGGRNCSAFTTEIDRTVMTADGDTADGSTHETIWVDEQTLHIIRIEFIGDLPLHMVPNGEGYQERSVFDNFHYNEAPPPGVFDWSPPPGVKVEGHW